MKRLKEIRLMVESAQQKWCEINDSNSVSSLSGAKVSEKKERLRILLENIRENIDAWLSYSHSRILADVCKKFLENIFKISESLRTSYAFPGYVESYYILDTLKVADGLAKRKN